MSFPNLPNLVVIYCFVIIAVLSQGLVKLSTLPLDTLLSLCLSLSYCFPVYVWLDQMCLNTSAYVNLLKSKVTSDVFEI